MPSESDHGPRNAFSAEFLSRLDEIAEPDGAHEADAAGPWAVRPVPYLGGTGFGLLRQWESVEAGDVPYAVFRARETALLAAAILPATGRDPLFRLATEPDAAGFPLLGSVAPPAPRAETVPDAPDGAHDRDIPPSAPSASPSPAGRAFRASPAGHLRDFDEGLATALQLVAALVRSPTCLAMLLEAAGYVALEQVGRILHRRIS